MIRQWSGSLGGCERIESCELRSISKELKFVPGRTMLAQSVFAFSAKVHTSLVLESTFLISEAGIMGFKSHVNKVAF